jgi:phage-related protein
MPSQAVLELLVNLKDNASSGLASLGSAVGSLGMVAGGVALAGVAGLGAAIVSGVGDAREAAKVYAQTEAVIKSTGGAAGVTANQVSDLAASLSAASGKSLFGDDDIQQSTNLLLTFTEIKGKVLDVATAVTVDMAQAMGGAPKDAAIQLGKALNDPIKGMTALSKVGVSFTDEQKAQVAAMQKAGDMAGAQTIILNELNKEFGGSAAAAAEADGGWAQFNDRMGEAKETLGAAVLPLLNMLTSVLNTSVLPIVESAAAGFASLVGAFQTGASDGAGFIGGITNALYSLDTVSPIFDTIADSINTLAQSFDEGGIGGLLNNLIYGFTGVQGAAWPLIDVIDGIRAGFEDGGLQGAFETIAFQLAQISPTFALLKGAVEAALPPIQEIVLSVFGIITSFIQQNGAQMLADVTAIWTQIQGLITALLPPIQSIVASVFGAIATFLQANGADIQAFFTTAWNAIAEIVKTALAIIQAVVIPVLAAVAGFIAAHGTEIQAMLKGTWDAISGMITIALNLIQGVLKTVLLAISGDWSGAWQMLQQTSAQFVQGILDVVTKTMGDLQGVFTEIVGAIKATWDGFVGGAAAIGSNIVQGIISGVKNAAGALYSALQDMASNALQAAKDAIGISSPSKDFANEVGNPIVQGIVAGIQGTAGSLMTTMANLTGGLVTGAAGAMDQLANAITGAEAPDSEFLGEGILDGIMSGMKGQLPKLKSLVESTANTVEEAFKGAFDINSPSEVMANAIGSPLIQGIIQGMEGTLPDLFNSLNQIALNVLGALDEKLNDETRTKFGKMIDDLAAKAKEVGSSFNDVLASGFGAEGSIDRQLAKNLDALAKVGDKAREFASSALQDAQKVAAQFADPSTGAKYLKMRSDQIFELAKLQEQINNETDVREKARLQQQMNLIVAAQAAEQRAFGANAQGQSSPLQKVIDQINAVLKSADDLTNASGVDITSNPIIAQLLAYRDQLLNGAGGFNMPTFTPLAASAPAPGTVRDNGLPPGRTINNTFVLPAGSDRQTADAVVRQINKQVNGRR